MNKHHCKRIPSDLENKLRVRGFSLVELLIVMIVLGILSAMAVPHIGRFSTDTKTHALEADLHRLRDAIERYAAEHGGDLPGTLSGTTTWDNFVVQLTKKTDKDGLPGTRYGPYLRTGIPRNPFNGLNTGTLGTPPVSGNENLGWYYAPSTGTILPAWPPGISGGTVSKATVN